MTAATMPPLELALLTRCVLGTTSSVAGYLDIPNLNFGPSQANYRFKRGSISQPNLVIFCLLFLGLEFVSKPRLTGLHWGTDAKKSVCGKHQPSGNQ